ncbi:MAG: cytochrome c oxidase subunit II [Bdellovibrionaceae bacterium]|nr:cytochrome c oxidase subunit II [Pseudobdellovibrionaceae bacterium]
MPPAATQVAKQLNHLYAFMLISSVISFIILVGGMIYFVYKYKRKTANDKTPYISHNHTLEFIWSFIPFVIFMACFAWGAYIYKEMRTFDENALEINVYGKKWVWEFEYKDGRKITNGVDANGKLEPATMVVPVNTPVKLLLTSVKLSPEDKAVLHSFFVPAFRVKQDALPGRYTALTFTADEKGLFQVFCAEYCGTGHSSMMAKIKVVSKEDFDAWVLGEEAGGAPKEMTLADKGRAAYAKWACIGCHTLDGSPSTGPSWKGLWGNERSFNDGGKAVADENYIRESIMDPNKHVVKGFEPNKMPTFKGMISDEDITAIIEFIKTLK